MASSATLLLDLDGTIVDSLPDLAGAINRLMATHGLAAFAPQEIARMIGDGTTKLVERAFAARGRDSRPGDLDVFLADYTAHATVATHAFPGVDETLGTLQAAGWQFAICTNKTAAATTKVLDALGLTHWFVAVGSGDSFPVRKPNPAHLLATLEVARGSAAHAVMVGDHANDVAAARGAAIPSVFAAWGYGVPSMAQGAAAVAQRFTDLAAIVPRLIA